MAGIDRHEQFPPRTASVRAARRLAADVLRDARYPGDVETVLLLLSELVTNAVRHAATEFELHLQVEPHEVTVVVVDHDRSHPPLMRNPTPQDTHGRGLQIVDKLASSWGSEPLGGDAKQVWFRCEAAVAISEDRARAGNPAAAVRGAPPSVHPTRR